MSNLSSPLTDDELDRLDRFLLDRVDEDAVTDGMDEGVLNVSRAAAAKKIQAVLPALMLQAVARQTRQALRRAANAVRMGRSFAGGPACRTTISCSLS